MLRMSKCVQIINLLVDYESMMSTSTKFLARQLLDFLLSCDED